MEPVRTVPLPGGPTLRGRESPVAAVELARLLRAAGYESHRIQQRLATGDELLARSPELPSYLRRLGDADELALLLRLFLLGVPVDAARFSRLVGVERAAAPCRGRAARRRRGLVHGAARLVPHDELLIASDHAGCGRRARRSRARRTPPVRRPRPPDGPRGEGARPRPLHRERHPGDPARRSRGPRDRDRREHEGARLRDVQHGAQRRRQRRDAGRQLLRARRGRAVRPRRGQPAVRRVARERVPVPRRRPARRRSVGARRPWRPGRARAGGVRLGPDRLGARTGRPCRASPAVARRLGLRRVPAAHLDGRSARDRDGVEPRSPRPARRVFRGARPLARVLPQARDRAPRLRLPRASQARRRPRRLARDAAAAAGGPSPGRATRAEALRDARPARRARIPTTRFSTVAYGSSTTQS